MLKSPMLLIPENAVTIQTDHRGRALIVTKDIEPGTVIGDYMGVFYPESKDEELEETHGLYAMEYDANYIIFPTEEERNSKDVPLINHSCEENCGIITYKGHALYYALRKIFAGEELTVCYSIEPDSPSPLTKYQCRCGSDFCRGTFCVSMQAIQDLDEFENGLPGGDEPGEPAVEGKHEQPLAEYPPTIPDYPEFDIYGSTHVEPLILNESSLPPIEVLRTRIRESGRCLHFKPLNLLVRGIRSDIVLTEYSQ